MPNENVQPSTNNLSHLADDSNLASVSSNIGVAFLGRNVLKGRDIEIPSLDITINQTHLTNSVDNKKSSNET
jgi:hypothetical protein